MNLKIIFLLLFLFSTNTSAADFSVKVWGALSGVSDPNIYFYYDYFSYKYKSKPIVKDDSYWFNGNKTFYTIKSDSVFISNGTSPYNFIGIVLDGKPEQVIEQLNGLIGVKFEKLNPNDKYSSYYNKSGTEVLWYGSNKTKIVYKIKNSKYKFKQNPF